MKSKPSTIPLADRKEWAKDPFYSVCALKGHHGHECGGKITWEHAMIYGGKKMQTKWSVIPLCERAHAVNSFQDAGTMIKELNQWVALNRATDDELRAISKAVDYIHMRKYLNGKYGVWTAPKAEANINYLKEMSIEDILWNYRIKELTTEEAVYRIENGLYTLTK